MTRRLTKCSCPSFQTSPVFTPQRASPHSLARWSSQLWQGQLIFGIRDLSSDSRATFFCLPLCRDVKFESLNGRNMVITALLELTGDLGKLTKVVRIQVSKDHKLQPNACSVSQVCKLTWFVHGNSCLATCNQLPSSYSNCQICLSQIAKCICRKLKKRIFSNCKIFLSQMAKCICLKLQNIFLFQIFKCFCLKPQIYLSQVCKLTWFVHGNSCPATCNQMPSSCSSPALIALLSSKSHRHS